MSVSNTPALDADSTQLSNPKICYWDEIPYEIREKIFQDVEPLAQERFDGGSNSYFRRNTTMPALVIALRRLPKSYGHVFEWYAKANKHLIYFNMDGCDLSDMTPTELAVIETADFYFTGTFEENTAFNGRSWYMNAEYEEAQRAACFCIKDCRYLRKINPPVVLRKALSNAINLREVTLRMATWDDHDKLHFLTEFPFCLEGLGSLAKVTVYLPKHIWDLDYMHYDQYDKVVDGMIKHLDHKLGIRGEKTHTIAEYRSSDSSGLYVSDETAKWTWEAYPGQLMDWSSGLGRVWKFPRECQQEWTPLREAKGQLYILEVTSDLRTWD